MILRYAASVAEQSVKIDADAEVRGLLLSLYAMGGSASALDRLDDHRRSVCSQAWLALGAASPSGREKVLSEWRAELARPWPEGLERLHPSWIVAALEGEPAYMVQTVWRALPDPVRVMVQTMPALANIVLQSAGQASSWAAANTPEVLRLAFGWLAPLCESTCGPNAEGLSALALDDLLSEVTRRGARAVGQSLSGAAQGLRARAMAAAGEPWAQVIGEVSALGLSDPDRKIALGHANTRLPDSARTPGERLLYIGLSVLKSDLVAEHQGSIYRVAGRLPVAMGKTWLGW